MVKTSACAENLTSAKVLTSRARTTGRYSTGETPPIKAEQPVPSFRSLEIYMNERQHYLRGSEQELFSQTWRKSAVGDSAEPK